MSAESPLKGTEAGDNLVSQKFILAPLLLVFVYALHSHYNDIDSIQAKEIERAEFNTKMHWDNTWICGYLFEQ